MGCCKSKQKPKCNCKYNDSCFHKPIIVNTQYGVISGFQYKDISCVVNVFLGIPFAAPPINDLRFKKPEKPQKWIGIYEATKYKAQSIQKPDIITNLIVRVPIKEDCLYLNIVTPQFNTITHTKYPVIVYIHGGSFCNDSAARYHYSKCASYLVKHSVIVVTIQYRLGFLGYFYTGDDTCQTNNGLWDQYFALKWVKENIATFYGDPNNITVVGQSAGGASVDLLSLSPISKETFHKCIILGGNADALWAIADKQSLLELCREKALDLGFIRKDKNAEDQWTREDNVEMMKFLKNVPAKLFAHTKASLLPEKFYESILDIAPVVDGEILPKMPYLLRKESKPKPTILGICKYEGLIFAALTKNKNPESLLESLVTGQQIRFKKCGLDLTTGEIENMLGYDETQKLLIEPKLFMKNVVKTFGDLGINISVIDFILNRWKQQSELKTFIEEGNCLSKIPSTTSITPTFEIGNFYTKTRKKSKSSQKKKGKLNLINKKFKNFKNRLNRKPLTDAPLYLFRFDHFNRKNFRAISAFFPFIGATHCTELNYILGVNQYFVPFTKTKADIKVSFYITSAMTNFAKYGNPNGINNEGICNTIWDPVKMEPTKFNFNFLKVTKDMHMNQRYGNDRLLHLAKFYRYLKIKETIMEEESEKQLCQTINKNEIESVLSDVIDDSVSTFLTDKLEVNSSKLDRLSRQPSPSNNTTTA
ncbi:Carboxylesterase, type B domain-containing protein [Strongyloides ratti]|uniref:Carboxylesterase, type B domain-containing protein n=1 Tax=Strongyloides ratti TaxID=34506 RepID=A0A090L7H2_STRRB|nr:Carboxylesterase, type B domain-containing protein [Strongyloides ratti]CEF63474.1 Carboxylesterase, type B domain-containing protein [Strongyloides ratti]